MIVDFYCHSARLVVEVDGDVHLDRQVEDQERDEVIRGLGLNVIHIRNEEVIDHLPEVLDKLRAVMSEAPHSLSGKGAWG
jgi:very-short-patch-repair endonuclease